MLKCLSIRSLNKLAPLRFNLFSQLAWRKRVRLASVADTGGQKCGPAERSDGFAMIRDANNDSLAGFLKRSESSRLSRNQPPFAVPKRPNHPLGAIKVGEVEIELDRGSTRTCQPALIEDWLHASSHYRPPHREERLDLRLAVQAIGDLVELGVDLFSDRPFALVLRGNEVVSLFLQP